MSRQDKTTTDRFARTLRELVKQPENKLCADCKRNDPRWASWNIGVFLCIRCSGIHRGMGTHISKVKSIDLDTWTPEQMESIQKWGNYLANLYWEAHLRAGHVPPDHKMESFIRSKYESRRWALDGLPPTDPSVLVKSARDPPAATEQSQQPQKPQQFGQQQHTSATQNHTLPLVTPSQPQAHQLLSANFASGRRQTNVSPAPPAPVQAEPPVKTLENDLFSLDFHAPLVSSNTTSAASKKDVKQDILSLFSNPPVTALPSGQVASATSLWTTQQLQSQPQQPQVTSMLGTSGVGAWGANSGWEQPAQQTQNNVWGASPVVDNQRQQPFFNTAAVWGTPAVSATAPTQDPFGNAAVAQKKDDAFGDLWGGFK